MSTQSMSTGFGNTNNFNNFNNGNNGNNNSNTTNLLDDNPFLI